MLKKYFKISFLALLTALVVPCFVSCGDDGGDGSTGDFNTPQYESVSGKYEIKDSSSPYASIELGASGDYIITKRGMGYGVASQKASALFTHKAPANRASSYGNIIYGTFSKVDDNTFLLDGFGTVRLASTGGQSMTTIVINPEGGGQMTYKAEKAKMMADDDLTNALCRTWKVTQVRERGYDAYEGEYDDIYIPEENPDDDEMVSEIMISKSGTFVNFYTSGLIRAFYWKWENMGKREIRSSMDNIWYNGDEGIATVTFSAGNKLTLREYYRDLEDNEWYEITVDMVEKNPAPNNDEPNMDEEEDNGYVPNLANPPLDKVFKGKLLAEVDDHGMDKFVYNKGFLTQVINVEDGYKINFDYTNFMSGNTNSEPDVRYTKKLANGNVEYTYDVWLNKEGFAERIHSKHYDRYGRDDFSFISTCRYDNEGHLVYLDEGREERNYSLTWENGNISRLDVTGSTEYTHVFAYGDAANANNLMFFYDLYHMDIEELKYLYWGGLLGVSTKNLVTISEPGQYNNSVSHYKWEANKVVIMENVLGTMEKYGEIPFWFAN